MMLAPLNISTKFLTSIFISLLWVATPLSAFAQEALPAPIAAWYQALENADEEALGALLTDDAIIELRDIEISQTKGEFIQSLDEWQESNKGATILTRLVESTDTSANVDVCYRFEDSEVEISETFTLIGDQISGSVQEQQSDSCEDF